MANVKMKKLLLGSVLVGGLVGGLAGCSQKGQDKDDKQKTEKDSKVDKYGNIKLFEQSRSDMKFALAFVENYYPYIYTDNPDNPKGGTLTTGHGLTRMYAADGSSKRVTESTPVPSVGQSDIYKGRYLTFEVLDDVANCFTVPVDENTLIAACVLRYCIGTNFRGSKFLEYVNAGKKGKELAKTLTGYRQQKGVINRCYFFAALIAGEIEYSDLLDLRAEGCYNLEWTDMLVYKNGNPKKDKDDFLEWDFSKIKQNLAKAKRPRTTILTLADGSTVRHKCKLTKEIVPDYIWQDVSNGRVEADESTVNFADMNADAQNDISYLAYLEQDYETALEAGKNALSLSKTNKQYGASYYNLGVTYAALGKNGKAVQHLKKSMEHNPTKLAKQALDEAQAKYDESCKKTRRGIIFGVGALGVAGFAVARARQRYLAQKKGHRHR